MKLPARDATLGALALLAMLAAAWRWRDAELASLSSQPSVIMPLVVREPTEADSLGAAIALLARSHPFRLWRGAVTRPRDAPDKSAAVPAAPSRLELKAIVGGPPWQAVLDGLPGQPPGTLVATGSEVGGLRVQAITRDSVVLGAGDSVWTLTIRPGPR